MSVKDARIVKEKYESSLLAIPGVTGVGYNGSINIYVKDLDPKILQMIPDSVDGIPVHVRKASFKLMKLYPVKSFYGKRVTKHRPAPGGVSVGHTQVTAGTLTCKALDRSNGEVLGLSNNHVVALDWGTSHIGQKGDSILQPGPADGGTYPNDILGYLERWESVSESERNYIDAGVFYSDELAKFIEEIGEPDSTMEPYVGQNIIKSGRTSGVNYTKVIDIGATISVEGDGVCLFHNQIITEPACLLPGDSGSWGGDVDTYRNVGLGFAGDENLSVFNRMSEVEKILDIEVVPPLGYLPLLPTISPLILGTVISNLSGVRKLAN